MSLLSCVKWYKLYLDIFQVGCDFQDVEFDQSNKKSLMNLKYFPEHSEELNLTASLETNKNFLGELKWKIKMLK